jgi:XTP/dITP diphosphohydrolase
MGKRIVFATGNQNKMIEIRQILGRPGLEIVSMKEIGLNPQIDENGATFEENALIKARAVAALCDDIVLADDSGLEIDCLNKEPGVHSARFMGENTSYEIKNQAILDRLKGVPREQRTARFVCAIAAVVPGHEPIVARGTIEGYIGDKPAGSNGFGYDPIFYVEDRRCSTAELSPEEKNARSHRGNALRAMRKKLEELDAYTDCE